MRKAVIPFLLALALLLTACAGKQAAGTPAETKAVPVTATDPTADILNTFYGLCSFPRPSHHEEQICGALEEWAKEQQLAVIRDGANNLIIEVPATKGMESKPLVALQGHMDMVFAQKAGANLDPLTTAIRPVSDGTFLRSDGSTSLGADDGIGLAIMMNIAEGKMPHGPLRLIITTNEENGMTGTFSLDPSHLADVQYLINLDAEEEGSMCLSTAAGVVETFDCGWTSVNSVKDTGIQIELRDLRGGHSGLTIGEGRLNAIRAIGEMLGALDEAGIDYELSCLSGGTAPNAIPAAANAVICVSSEDSERALQLLSETGAALQTRHADTDPDMTVLTERCEPAERVLTAEARRSVLDFLSGVTNGVVTMSKDVDGLVESSSNLGLFTADADGVSAKSYVRSSSPAMLTEILKQDEALGKDLGFSYGSEKTADPWPYNPNSRLAAITDEAYRSLFGKEIAHLTIHAGIECGTFSVYNSELDMIALGPTLRDVHSVDECLEIASVAKVWSLIERILAEI